MTTDAPGLECEQCRGRKNHTERRCFCSNYLVRTVLGSIGILYGCKGDK